ncbi:MAG: UPF0280 family protein [Armatimonadota bacterium]
MQAHQPRRYRKLVASTDLVACEVAVGETDLQVLAERDLRAQARAVIYRARRAIEGHAALHPEFLEARVPLPTPPDARGIVAAMYGAAWVAGVGPMAAVAGAIAEVVARELAAHSAEVIVENGGDLFLITLRERLVAIDAGASVWGRRVALALPPGERAVCTSSGTIGHSASGGRADAAVVVAPEGAVADALATALANRVAGPDDVESAVEWARGRDAVEHIVVICGTAMATWGRLELRRREGGEK